MSDPNNERIIEANLKNYKDSICDKVRFTIGTAQ